MPSRTRYRAKDCKESLVTTAILLLGLLLLAAFAWARSFDRSRLLRGTHVEPWWQRRHLDRGLVRVERNRRRV